MDKKPFQVVERCQAFCAKVYTITVKAEKEYRSNLCRVVQDCARDAIHSARIANAMPLTDPERQWAHKEAIEDFEKINDLLPVLRRTRCLSVSQEKELNKDLGNLMFAYNKWMKSDAKRILEGTEKKKGDK